MGVSQNCKAERINLSLSSFPCLYMLGGTSRNMPFKFLFLMSDFLMQSGISIVWYFLAHLLVRRLLCAERQREYKIKLYPMQEVDRRESQVSRCSILWGGRKPHRGCCKSNLGVQMSREFLGRCNT